MFEFNTIKQEGESGMEAIMLKVTDQYPEECFDSQKQKEWAKVIVDRLCVFAQAGYTVSRTK